MNASTAVSANIIETHPRTPDSLRSLIFEMETKMMQHKDLHIEMETNHHFAKGLYARELVIPRGVLLTGKIHKYQQLNIVLKGDITVWTEEGMKRITAPYIFTSYPGAKRVGFAHEDTVWVTIIATDATPDTDLDELEDSLVCSTEAEFLQFLEQEKIGGPWAPLSFANRAHQQGNHGEAKEEV